MNKLSTDGETSEAESSSSVSELQDPILRVTRRRKILVACTPVSSVRKKLKVTPINESHTEEEVSEAESHVSGISRIVPSTVVTTRTRRIKAKAKSLTDPSQESHAEAVSDAESSCSDISTFSGFVTRRTTRSMQRKLQAVTEEKDTKIIPENEKPMINIPMNSDTRQTSPYIQARFLSQINEPDFSNNEICNDFDDDSFHGNSEKTKKTTTIIEHLLQWIMGKGTLIWDAEQLTISSLLECIPWHQFITYYFFTRFQI